MTQRWAYLGPEGTFTEQAAHDLVQRVGPADAELIPHSTVSAALAALRAGEVDAAVVPVENSVEGAVALTHDELAHGEAVGMFAEAFVPVTFSLLARPGARAADIRTVGSHPHGHAQVRDWLVTNLPHAQPVTTSSTAAAAAQVAAGELDAAAAAPMAGVRYGLEPLATDIGLDSAAVTRFALLRRPGPPPPRTGNDRTSLILSVPNRPGALFEVLQEVAVRGINMVRLESRPARSRMGDYVFLLDVDGHLADPAIGEMVQAVARRSGLLRWLGSYPRAAGENVPVPDYASEDSYDRAHRLVRDLLTGKVTE